MAWRAYRWRFRMESPLHVGFRNVANLQRTRPYVPARNLWAAATARIAQWFGSSTYAAVGEDVSAHLRFGFLYPELDGQVQLPPLDCERERFLLDSLSSTALDPGSTAAEAGSLHEIEVVLPRTRQSPPRETVLLGLLWAQDGVGHVVEFARGEAEGEPLVRGDAGPAVSVKELFSWLQVGGERRYGLGRLRLLELVPLEGHTMEPFDGVWDGSDEAGPSVNLAEKARLWAHAIVGSAAVAGDIEAVVGRDWSERGAGRQLTRGRLCWSPGSLCEAPQAFRVSSQGLWIEIEDDIVEHAAG